MAGLNNDDSITGGADMIVDRNSYWIDSNYW